MGSGLEIFDNKNILITGGGGYLGSKLAERLSLSNSNIYLLDIEFNKISKLLNSNNDKVTLQTIDLTNKESLVKVCEKIKPDFIFHFAAILNRNRNFNIYDKLNSVNVGGTFNLLEAIKDFDYQGFYFASTSEVYGVNNKVPFSEDQQAEPSSPYSLTKFMAETLCKSYSELYNKPYTVLRLFNFFGPEMSEETFVGQILAHYRLNKVFQMTKGIQKRDFVYIDDLIDQILFIVNSGNQSFNIFNICTGKSYSMIEVAEAFKKLTQNKFHYEKTLAYRPNEIWEMYGSNQRIISMGYKPSMISLSENLNKIIK